LAYKPGSVSGQRSFCPLGSHSSGSNVTITLMQPTRVTGCAISRRRATRLRLATPIRSCFRWGLPCLCHYWQSGKLLPHPFTLTRSNMPPPCGNGMRTGGLLSVALSLKSPSPGVTRHRFAWSPDFPHQPPFGFWLARLPSQL